MFSAPHANANTHSRGRGRPSRLVVLIVMLLVGGVAGVGIAYAAIPSSSGVISGCIDAKSGALRVINAESGQQCTSKERPLAWNQTGPQGVPGVPGSPGAPGAPGAPGPGLTSIDDLAGLPCRLGKPGEGVLEVGYGTPDGASRPVTFGCHSSTLYALTVTRSTTPTGTGGTVTGGPIDCGSSCNAQLAPEAEVQLVATPATGYRFDHWSGGCTTTSTQCTLAMNGDTTVTAHFVKTYTLTIGMSETVIFNTATYALSVSPSTAGFPCVVGPTTGLTRTCVGRYDAGTSVTISTEGAVPVNGWQGECLGSSTTCTVTMNSDKQQMLQFFSL